MAIQITMYETKDGKYFRSQIGADNHEKFLDFEDWYEENKLYEKIEGCRIEWEGFIEWLKENKKEVEELIKLI